MNRKIAAALLILAIHAGIPVSIALGYWIVPAEGMDDETRLIAHGAAVIACYPYTYLALFIFYRKRNWGPALVMGGTLIRLTLMAVLFFWAKSVNREDVSNLMVLYLATLFCYLALEILAALTVGISKTAGLKQDSNAGEE